MISIDTNLLLRYLLQDDEIQVTQGQLNTVLREFACFDMMRSDQNYPDEFSLGIDPSTLLRLIESNEL